MSSPHSVPPVRLGDTITQGLGHLPTGAIEFGLAQGTHGEVSIVGAGAAPIFRLLGPLPRSTGVRLQFLSNPSDPPQQLDLEVLSYHGEPKFKLVGDGPSLSGSNLQSLTLFAIGRDSLPALTRSDCPAHFNPLVMVWRAPEQYATPWEALRAHLGAVLSITSEFEGQRAQRIGTLSLTPRTHGKGEILALTAEDGKRATFAPDLGATIMHAALCHRGFHWQKGAASEPCATDIVELRSNIPEGVFVQVTLDDHSVARGLWRGVDDRYLPLIAIEMARTGETPARIFSRPLRSVQSIRTTVPVGQIAALRDIWPQSSAPAQG